MDEGKRGGEKWGISGPGEDWDARITYSIEQPD